MFRYQRSLLKLSSRKRSSQLMKPLVRFNSSSVKVQPNNNTTTASTTTATVDNHEKTLDSNKSKEQLELEAKTKIPFMPVINIPETEFAHNAFFSLYRPLLGLSDEDETPFFSKQPLKSEEERNQEKLDEMLATYMSNCTPFVDPTQLPIKKQGGDFTEEGGHFNDDGVSDIVNAVNSTLNKTTEVSFKVAEEEFQDFQDLFGEDNDDDFSVSQQADFKPPIEDSINRQQHQLPMFHMPESADVLDYLTTIESNMTQEHAKLDAEDKLKALRLKKMEILSKASSSFRQNRPRFYATNNRNVHQRLRRYQQKWILKE